MDLVKRILNCDKIGIAKAITLIEEQSPEAKKLIKQIYSYTGNAITIGITGPPGAGKSCIVNKLAKKLREKKFKVGIIAVDPTSPFSGGALLGDRIRMQDLALDEGVYIRSMGSRGALGGLSLASYNAVKVLDAAGMDYIIIETVGVGQSEVGIIKLADIVLLVLVPGMGDEIQITKAGIMEIGDIFVVNKSDMPGADRLVTNIQMFLDLNSDKNKIKPPVIKTVALTGEGISNLHSSIDRVFNILKENGTIYIKRKERIKQELLELINQLYFVKKLLSISEKVDDFAEKILNKIIDPFSAAGEILNKYLRDDLK